MTTLKEIADLAGVSRGTVDRVLNHRGSVNPKTAEKVMNIVQALDYQPNRAGTALAAQKKKYKIGVILFGRSNPFFDDVMYGVQAKADELKGYGITTITRRVDFDADAQLTAIDELAAEGINGLVLAPYNDLTLRGRINELSENHIPVVTINTDIEGSRRLAYVGSDYYQGGCIAAGLFALSPNCLYIRCNIIIVRRCGCGCLRAGVDILALFRRYRFTIQRVGYVERAVFRRCNYYRRLRPNHVDRGCRGQAVDGVGEGFSVAVCRYLLTVYLPRYNLIRGRLFIGKSDAAVGRATVAALNFCTVCGILCGQRVAVDSITALVHNTEVYFRRRCAVVDQCAYPDIVLQIANRVAQSGNAQIDPVAV